jgi:hypothetical protein
MQDQYKLAGAGRLSHTGRDSSPIASLRLGITMGESVVYPTKALDRELASLSTSAGTSFAVT